MVQEGVIDRIVRSLARQRDEAKEGILLLRVLSAKSKYADMISQAQGAVLLLVTLLSSEEGDVADNVKGILENLPTDDDHVIIMAEANLLTPLVARLVEGTVLALCFVLVLEFKTERGQCEGWAI